MHSIECVLLPHHKKIQSALFIVFLQIPEI